MAGGLAKSARGRGRRRSARKSRLSDINVTPFVDVMLVLLIVFMVTAPLLVQGIQVDLAKTEAKAMESENDPLTITIRLDGSLYIQQSAVESAQLVDQLRAISKEGYDRRIYVRADARVEWERIADVMARVSNAGFRRLSFETAPLDSPQRRSAGQ